MEQKIQLSFDQIQDILCFIKPFQSLPCEISNELYNHHKNKLMVQLKEIKIYPSLIPKLKNILEQKYYTSIISPGTAVGILCAQSIGEKLTQCNLNSFHKTGFSQTLLSKGIPRLSSLLNGSNSESQQYANMYVTSPIKDISYYKNQMIQILFKHTYANLHVHMTKLKYKIRFDIQDCYTHMIDKIYKKIKSCNTDCKIKIQKTSIIYKIYRDKIHIQNNIDSIYDYIEYILDSILISGIPNVKDVFYLNSNYILTKGYNFSMFIYLPYINILKSIPNQIQDIYDWLGIEAVYEYLLQEISDILEYDVNIEHIHILVSKLTFEGNIGSLSTFMSDNVIHKSTYKNSFETFIDAASNNKTDNFKNVSSNICFGNYPCIGTYF